VKKEILKRTNASVGVFTNRTLEQDFVHVILQVKTPCKGGVSLFGSFRKETPTNCRLRRLFGKEKSGTNAWKAR
jgi:hypothetical protein